MLGNLRDLPNGVAKRSSTVMTDDVDKSNEASAPKYKLEDLEIRRTLGVGAFGRVKLVKTKPRELKGGDPCHTRIRSRTVTSSRRTS